MLGFFLLQSYSQKEIWVQTCACQPAIGKVLATCCPQVSHSSICENSKWNHWSPRVKYPVQFSSVAQSCPTLYDPMNHSTPGLPVHQQLPQFTQTHVHRVGDGIQPSRPLSSPSPPAFNLSWHQGLFHWVSSSHQVAQVLEFQLQHQSYQWTPRTDLL